MVSNISIMQKVMMSATAVNQPMLMNVSKSNLKKVVFIISFSGGTNEAVARDANGLVSRKMKLPPQYMMQEMSMPRMTDALTLWWLRMTMAKTPTSMVTT